METGHKTEMYRNIARVAAATERMANAMEKSVVQQEVERIAAMIGRLERVAGILDKVEDVERFVNEVNALPMAINVQQQQAVVVVDHAGTTVKLSTTFEGFPNEAAAIIFAQRLRRAIAKVPNDYYHGIARLVNLTIEGLDRPQGE